MSFRQFLASGPSALYYSSITIAAGETKHVDLFGQMIRVKESSAVVYAEIDERPKIPLEVGLSYRRLDGTYFRKLKLSHDEDVTVTIGFYYGTDEITDDRLNTLIERDITMTARDPRTDLVGNNVDLDPGDTVTFIGTYGLQHRKQIVFTNTDASEDLKLRAPDANDGVTIINVGTLRPRIPWTIPTSSVVRVQNPATNANTITLEACATHYAE